MLSLSMPSRSMFILGDEGALYAMTAPGLCFIYGLMKGVDSHGFGFVCIS